MSKQVKYRLQPILDEKERLREDAIQFLNKKKDELKAEEKKLEQIKEELTIAIERKNQMTQEYNDKMFSGKYTVDEIKIRKIHIEDMILKMKKLSKL